MSSLSVPSMPTASAVPAESTYHRLLRSQARHRWWRPLVVGLVAAGLHLAVLLALAVAVVVVGLVQPAVGVAVERFGAEDLDLTDPAALALMLGLIALMLPALLLATRLVGRHPVGLLSSVTGRLRSRWLRTVALTAFLVWLPAMAVAVGAEALTGTVQVREVAPLTTVVLLVLTLGLVPFQAAAEEYVFRGYLAQLVGSWLRHPVFAVLLPVPLFVVGHGYGPLGAVEVAAFAVMAGWLTWRTGGLEAAIAAHVANNVVLMAISAVGLGDPNATDTDTLGLAVSLATMALFTVLVTRQAGSRGVARTALRAPRPVCATVSR